MAGDVAHGEGAGGVARKADPEQQHVLQAQGAAAALAEDAPGIEEERQRNGDGGEYQLCRHENPFG